MLLKTYEKGFRNHISLKQSSKSNCLIIAKHLNSPPNLLTHNSETITDPKNIANIFNDYFSTIAGKTKTKIKFSNKSFTDFLHHPIDD